MRRRERIARQKMRRRERFSTGETTSEAPTATRWSALAGTTASTWATPRRQPTALRLEEKEKNVFVAKNKRYPSLHSEAMSRLA